MTHFNKTLLGTWITLCVTWATAQSIPPDFLQTEVAVLDFAHLQEEPSIPLLDEELKHYRFFFTAEEHWLSINTQVQFQFLRYLHQRAGVRNLIVEGGYAYSDMLNQYLESGNEKLLLLAVYATPVCPEDFADFFRNVYRYNQSLPAEDRIQVAGIDLEQSPALVIEYLHRILPDKPPSSGVREKIRTLRILRESPYDEKEARKYFRQLHKEVQERRRAYRRFWEEDFWLFEMILENTVQAFDSPFLREFVYAHGDQKKREAGMYRTFRKLYQKGKLKPGNCYAQFGGIHTELNPSINWGYPTLAHNLNYGALSPVKGKVLTISKYFRRLPRIYEKFKDAAVFLELVAAVEARYPQEILLCRIKGNEDLFPEISKDFQYLLLIKETLENNRCN